MPYSIPTRPDETRKLEGYVRRDNPDLDPSVTRRRGVLGGLVRSIASALHDWYVMLKKFADHEPWPQTATEDFLLNGWWVPITGLQRKAAAAAQGEVVLTGTNGTVVGAGTALTATTGATYTTDAATTIIGQSLVGTSSIVGPTTARFVTNDPHRLATGMTLTFSGCVDTSANGDYEITVVDANTIDYEIPTPAGDTLAGTPTITGTWANVSITADATGTASNLTDGATLTISVVDVDSTARTTFGGIADGAEIETIESFRERILEALGTDFGMASADEISIVAKTVPGVTRVFVRKPIRDKVYAGVSEDGVPIEDDGYPVEGQFKVAFLREDDADPIPSEFEVAQVRAKLIAALQPAHVAEEDFIVMAPERYNVEVRFTSITPDTPGMRRSIRANILQYLKEDATWGGYLENEALRCAIRDAYDAETGQRLKSYTLATPTTDIALPVDAYPVLSAIRYTT